ncbi:uncharacterized protein B0P05DRAFT_574633 [Gilbertella persicaria]|uniref:uncharacterized protein n=1 Tax=Gilbertella persicaria TaxID=101096 RepID=UPI00221F17BD|nr:uncharacterized protein B0P05DRAFT_574633 [Gilbertella persicaria]KAI8061509.1 hypothetical protein B0P05DRAFT_574633 [Gilbertella persicaria]
MLRVYSLLYIERLWNPNLSSDIVKQVPVATPVNYGTKTEIVEPVIAVSEDTINKQVIEENHVQEAEEAIEEVEIQTCDEPSYQQKAEIKQEELLGNDGPIALSEDEEEAVKEDIVEVQEEQEIAKEVESIKEVQEIDTESIQEIDVQSVQEVEPIEKAASIKEAESLHEIESIKEVESVKEVESIKEEEEEKVVSSLAIDTKQHYQINTILESPIEEEDLFSASAAADHSTSISSSSSILSPLTPSSVHSSGFLSPALVLQEEEEAFEKKVQALPPPQPRKRTTSLFRRETDKLNDRRKSLTKKLKRALTVKSENKRYSV